MSNFELYIKGAMINKNDDNLYESKYHLTILDIEYLRNALPPNVEEEFFTYMKQLNPNDVTIYAIKEGSVVFPR